MERNRWGRQVRIRFGDHALRMGGMLDLLTLAEGATVLDVGCNRGLMCYHFAAAGARIVHGCDYYAAGIETAREWFADLGVQSQFEVIDLVKHTDSLKVFGVGLYDIVLLSAVIHKLRRQTDEETLRSIIRKISHMSDKYFAARVVDQDRATIEEELKDFDCVHWSMLDPTLGQCLIWKRR
jgi:2-polyprenyl-3-methyl-5-hydroxy-6-metoxy-1,4-benzoquinol methylase